MSTLDEIDGQIDQLKDAGKLNTPKHLELERIRAELFRTQQSSTSDKPKAIKHITPHGHTVILDDPKKLVIEQGFLCIDGGNVKHNGKIVRLMVRYDNKPELAKEITAWLKDWQLYVASKAAEFERNVPGLKALGAARDAASNEEDRYQLEFEGGLSPRRRLDTSLRDKARKLAKEYPRALMYLRANSYTYASNCYKCSAGQKAMELIANGGSLDKAAGILTNWKIDQ